MNFSELIEIINNLFSEEAWIIEVFVVVMLTGFLSWILKRSYHRIISKLEQTKTFWDDIFFDALIKPLSVLIWITGIAFAADIVKEHTGSFIFSAVSPLYRTGVLVVICWFLIRFITRAERNIILAKRTSGEEIDQTTVDAIAKLLRISVIIIGVLVVLQSLGYSISGVLAFGGVGGAQHPWSIYGVFRLCMVDAPMKKF